MKTELKMLGLGALGAMAIGAVMFLGTTDALAADNLPLEGQAGYYVGIEASTNYMHIKTEPDVDVIYTVATPMALVTAGYGTDVYSFGIFGGAGFPSVRKAFDEFGDADDTVPVFGVNAKLVPVQIGSVKLGLVADAKYVGSARDSAKGTIMGLPLDATLSYGPMWLWSAGAIAQYQPSKYFTVYAGETYEDIAHAKSTMRATIGSSANSYTNEVGVRFKQVDRFATVAGMVIAPSDRMNVILQGRYTKGIPMSATANIEYRF